MCLCLGHISTRPTLKAALVAAPQLAASASSCCLACCSYCPAPSPASALPLPYPFSASTSPLTRLPTNFAAQAEAAAEAETEAEAAVATVKRTFSSCCQLVSVRFGFGFASDQEAAPPLSAARAAASGCAGRCLCRATRRFCLRLLRLSDELRRNRQRCNNNNSSNSNHALLWQLLSSLL